VNAWRAPSRVGEAHSVNKFDDFPRHGRPALGMATLPPPIGSESSPMPCDHCFRLDDRQGRTPAAPELREPGPEHPICDAPLYFVGAHRTLKDQQLVAEGENLGVTRSSDANALPNRVEQREDDRNHVDGTYREVRATSTGSISAEFSVDTGAPKHASAVSFTAMENTSNLDSVRSGADKEEPVVADAKPEFFSSLECLYVTFAGFHEAMQGIENAHGGGLVQAADIGLSRFRPDDALHLDSLKRSISS
jgi:hypothetical protein